jgi:hypothetical protein
MAVDTDKLAKAIAQAAEEYEKQYGHLPSKAKVTLSKSDSISQTMQRVRIAKAREAREDVEIVAKVVQQYHPELSHAQAVSKVLEIRPEWYDDMVGA